jgi:hypothetical protein
MKLSLSLSIFLNLVLVSVLARILANHRPGRAAPLPMAQSASVPGGRQQAAPQFRWSQLESTNDCRAYIANLRAAGCPEITLRAIVDSDTEAAFALTRQQLELTGTDRFSQERAKEVAASLLNESPASAKTSFSTPNGDAETQMSSAPASSRLQPNIAGVRVAQQDATTTASYPLTLQNPVLHDATLNNNQKAAVQQIQQQFVNAIGGPNQDPHDPAYAARWQTAQHDADDALRATLGNQAYQGYQLQHYFSNFQQVMLDAGGGPVTIDPDALAN